MLPLLLLRPVSLAAASRLNARRALLIAARVAPPTLTPMPAPGERPPAPGDDSGAAVPPAVAAAPAARPSRIGVDGVVVDGDDDDEEEDGGPAVAVVRSGSFFACVSAFAAVTRPSSGVTLPAAVTSPSEKEGGCSSASQSSWNWTELLEPEDGAEAAGGVTFAWQQSTAV